MVILHDVKVINFWTIKRRSGKEVRAERLPQYVAVHPDGNITQEFRRLDAAIEWCLRNSTRRTIRGQVEVCCHRVCYWYDILDFEETDLLLKTLEEEAESRVKHCINDGCICGELCCCYHVGSKEAELRGWWNIVR